MNILTDTLTDVQRLLENAKLQIQANLASEGINASGRTSDSLRVIVDDNTVKLVQDISNGCAPIATAEVGRNSGRIPYDFTRIVYEWSMDKGLSFENDKERMKFAGAVAWGKIRNRGYGRPGPSDFGRVKADVYSPVVEDVENSVRDLVTLKVAEVIRKNITT